MKFSYREVYPQSIIRLTHFTICLTSSFVKIKDHFDCILLTHLKLPFILAKTLKYILSPEVDFTNYILFFYIFPVLFLLPPLPK